jgi:glutamyl endopeptidase
MTMMAGIPAALGDDQGVDPNTSVSNTGATAAPTESDLGSVSPSSPGAGGAASTETTSTEPTASPIGGIGTTSVIGADGRARVSPTTGYPWRAIGRITFQVQGRAGTFGCTGWLIGKHTLATAGHCVYDTSVNKWATLSSVRFYPGQNGASTPWGSCTAAALYSVQGWTVSEDRNYDYAAIRLASCTYPNPDSRDIGINTGYFGFFWQSASLLNYAETISGYPGDKPTGQQWRMSDKIRVSQTYRIFYSNDTAGGQSGAPIFYNKSGCGQCSMGIHTTGVGGSYPGNTYNGGTRIRQAVFNNYVNWKSI